MTLPDADGGRAVTPIEHGSALVGALVHDPILLRSPERMQTACAAAGLALDNGRLKADLRARLQDVRESRARIVEAGDRERRRVERNLHDGAQQRLMGVAMTLRLAEAQAGRTAASGLRAAGPAGSGDGAASGPRAEGQPTGHDGVGDLLAEAAAELDGALRDLRELARGLHPAILTEVGLDGALEALAERSAVPVRLRLDLPAPTPEPVAVGAYYVVAEALANVAKHAGATAVTVRLTHERDVLVVEVADDGRGGAHAATGSGLQGLGDRVDALDGRMRIASPAGGGTILTVELPCA